MGPVVMNNPLNSLRMTNIESGVGISKTLQPTFCGIYVCTENLPVLD